MSEVIRQGWLYWKLTLFKLANGSVLAVAMVFLAATDGVDIAEFSFWQKVRLVIYCSVAGFKVIEAFLDDVTGRLAKGKPPLPSPDDTNTWTKTDIQQTMIHTPAPPAAPGDAPKI